jgi:hypothetical protein
LACGGMTNPDAVGDAVAEDDCAPAGEAAALAVAAALAAAAALALAAAAARSAFLVDTAVMSEKSREAARATPTIRVMIGVEIFMPGGTQHGPWRVQRFSRT